MKKFIFTFTLFVFSSFLFSSFVNAYSKSYELSEEDFSALSYVSAIKVKADEYMSLNPSYVSYVIYYQHRSGRDPVYGFYVRKQYDFYITTNGLQLDNSQTGNCVFDITNDSYICSNNSLNYVSPYTITGSSLDTAILYSSKPIYIGVENTSIGDTFTWTYNDDSYSITSDGVIYFPTLIELNDYFNPTNSDLLASFVFIVCEKIGFISNYIQSNTIFLTIFVIFILYYAILLFRRLS